MYGVLIEAEGPSHVEDVEFYDFKRNQYREAAALAWKDEYRRVPFKNKENDAITN